MASPFQIEYSPEAVAEIEALRTFEARKIIDNIEHHLRHGPKTESRSRIKRLQQPMWAEFRLRVNGFRIYYNVYDDRGIVEVLRILWKDTGQTPEEPP